MDLPIRLRYPPAQTKEVKDWIAAGKPVHQPFKSEKERQEHLKYVEDNKETLPF